MYAPGVLLHHVKHTNLGDEVHTPLALLLLKLERNASHRAPLNTLHEVGHKASDLVPHPLGRDDGNLVAHPLVRVEVHGQARVVLLDDGTRRLLHGLRADTLNARSVESSCRQRQRPVIIRPARGMGRPANEKVCVLLGWWWTCSGGCEPPKQIEHTPIPPTSVYQRTTFYTRLACNDFYKV